MARTLVVEGEPGSPGADLDDAVAGLGVEARRLGVEDDLTHPVAS